MFNIGGNNNYKSASNNPKQPFYVARAVSCGYQTIDMANDIVYVVPHTPYYNQHRPNPRQRKKKKNMATTIAVNNSCKVMPRHHQQQ
jgi:hypothetical protein